MKLFNAQQLSVALDYNETFSGVSIVDQFEVSLDCVSKDIIQRYDLSTTFYVFAGHGDNGGDALGLARRLVGQGYTVNVYLINPNRVLTDHCSKNRILLEEFDKDFIIEIGKGAFVPPIFDHQSVIIDGIVGSGISRSLSGGYKALVQFINQSGAEVISIDLPSGIGPIGQTLINGAQHVCVKASLTYSLGAPKYQSLLKDLSDYFGEVVVIDLQIHPKAIQNVDCEHELMDKQLIKSLIKCRPPFSEKRDFGHGYLIAGKRSMMGAAIISAMGALRSGLGMLTVHLPQGGASVLQSVLPEAICHEDKGDDVIEQMITEGKYQAIAVGPGIGMNPLTKVALVELINRSELPIVIDADGLNLLSNQPDLLLKVAGRGVITPHVREFDRLFGASNSDHERLEKAIQCAAKYGIVIVLKGRYTAVVDCSGRVYFNCTGNSGMSKSGVGDLLTGIILAMLSQGYTALESAQIGVFLHGMAADKALEDQSEISLLPTDICAKIGQCYNNITER